MVKPILLYGNQVWAQELLPYEPTYIYKLDRLPFEQIQHKQCKYIIGVRKHTSSVAARKPENSKRLSKVVPLLDQRHRNVTAPVQRLVFSGFSCRKKPR